jgi:hypothetical protein
MPVVPEAQIGGWRSKGSPGENLKPHLEKITKVKMAGGVAQVLELLPSRPWGQIPVTSKRLGKEQKR